MRFSLFFLLLFVLFGNQAYCQITFNQAGCTYYWSVRVEGSGPSSYIQDTLYCQLGDTVKIGSWDDRGGACPDYAQYEWYYGLRVCNQLNSFTPDTTVWGNNMNIEDGWFESTTYSGELTVNYANVGRCKEITIIRTEPASIGLLDSEKWDVFYDPNSRQIRTRTEESNSYELNLHSIDGRIVGSTRGVGNQQTDVSGLPSGIYIASIETEKGVLRKKLMIQPY